MLIWGTKGYSDHLGYIIRDCPECARTSPFSVYQQKKKFTIYFIPTFSYSSKQLIECGACKAAFEVQNEMKATIQELLMSQEELSALVANTDYSGGSSQKIAAEEPVKQVASGKKACPFCAEPIQSAAVFCRFCNHDLE